MGRGNSSKGAAANPGLAPWLDHSVYDDDAEQMVDCFADDRAGGISEEDEESEYGHGGYSDDDAEVTSFAAKASLPLAAEEDWGGRGRRYQDLGRFTETISRNIPLRPRGAMAERLAKPPARKSAEVQQPPKKVAGTRRAINLRTTPKAATRPIGAPAVEGGKRKREHVADEVEDEASLRAQAIEEPRRIDYDEVLFGEGVLHYSDVADEVVDALIMKIGGQPRTSKL